ncbi:hypothetical protein ACFW1A_08225 [Kitasatospora sp. NPDC058965]|uniref:hypothetical protein n=1 Tax=Kitasatospora sp. NPDC058965 TaxID=3346682 RepID=UPI0036ADFAEA
MGTDISGFVEYRAGGGERPWRPAIGLGALYAERDYDAFGCLFGVRNYAGFRPLAGYRGLPADVSEPVRAEYAEAERYGGILGASWIGWAELGATDWSEPAESVDSRIHEYRRTAEGLVPVGKSAWSARFAELVGLDLGESADWPEGSEWHDGDLVYRAERLTRRDAVPADGAWQPVWLVLEALARVHGEQNARLVVWFDS